MIQPEREWLSKHFDVEMYSYLWDQTYCQLLITYIYSFLFNHEAKGRTVCLLSHYLNALLLHLIIKHKFWICTSSLLWQSVQTWNVDVVTSGKKMDRANQTFCLLSKVKSEATQWTGLSQYVSGVLHKLQQRLLFVSFFHCTCK